MLRRVLISAMCLGAFSTAAFAGFGEHYALGQEYLSNYQFSSAILEFQNALKINYMDNSARIGLVNSYLANGSFLANKNKDYQGSADCYRSALFYLLYFPSGSATNQSSSAVAQVRKNLETCLTTIKFDKSPANRFKTAKQLRAEGKFAAAGYEFMQALGDRAYVKDSFEQIGDIMKLLRNNPKSVEYYRKAVALAPEDTDLRLSYAKMLDLTGNDDEAVKEFNFVLARVEDNPEVLYSLERIYKKKLDKSPSDANVTTNLGAILQKQGKFDEALAYYAKAEQLDRTNVNARINVGTLYQQKKDYKKAMEAYDSVLLIYPKNVQANLYKAQTYEEMGETQNALRTYEKVLALDPNNDTASYHLKNLLRSTLSTKEFVEYIKKHSTTGKPADELYLYALDLHKANKLDDAIAIYKEVISMSPNAEVYVNLAIAMSQKKDYNSAISMLKIAQSKYPDNAQVKDTLASIYGEINDGKLAKASELYNAGQYEAAVQIYSGITPMTEEIMLTIATCWQNLDNTQQALNAYKQAFAINPNSSDTAYYIATILIDNANSKEEGMQYLNKALALNPDNQDAKQLQAYLNEQGEMQALETAMNLFEQEKYDESLTMLNELIAKNPQNAYALYYRGMIYDAKERLTEAIKDYELAIKFNKELAIVNYLLGVDYDTLNKSKDALKNYEAFLANYQDEDDFRAYANSRVKDLKGGQ